MAKTYSEILSEALRSTNNERLPELTDDGARPTAKFQADNISFTSERGYTVYRTRFDTRENAEAYASMLDMLAVAFLLKDPNFVQATRITVL
jgi:hypothetical protein